MEGYVTTAQAARIIRCNASRVRQLLLEGKLQGEKVGRDWLVLEASAKAYRDADRKPGPKPAEKPRKKR